MKKMFASVVLAACSLGASAATIPLPNCVNGSWQAPSTWELVGGDYACKSNNDINPNLVEASYLVIEKIMGVTFFNNADEEVVSMLSKDVHAPAGGEWGNVIVDHFMSCPLNGGSTDINNCPIS